MTARLNHTLGMRPGTGYGRCRQIPVWNLSVPHIAGRVVLFPPIPMGQYFKAVNLDKKEVICPWCLGGGAKLWEWAANSQGAVFTLLLRTSSGGGGGDYYYSLPHRREVDVSGMSPQQAAQKMMEATALAVAAEGQPIEPASDTMVGRWAGDRVVLVGDYDKSHLWDKLGTYRNISEEVVRTWNEFMDLSDRKLTFHPDCSCRET